MSCRIHEEIDAVVALAPKSQSAGENDTTAYIDAQDFSELEFVITHGALAAGKKITVEVYGSHNANGAGAEKLGEKTVTAGAGGLASGIVRASVIVTANRGRYYAAKVTNDAAAAVDVGVVALGRVTHRHAETDALNI